MLEDDGVDVMDLFIEETKDENLQVQISAIKKLPTVAVVLDVEKTRSLLIPYLEEYLKSNFLHDEVLLTLAQQLESFVAFVGGLEHVHLVLNLLTKLCVTDETVVRDRAVQSLVHIASTLEAADLEKHLLPLIEKLAHDDWFTSKCSATGLFSVCYPKVSSEHQIELRNLFRLLIQDEQPMVRRATASNLVEFALIIDKDHLKTEFVPVLDNLVKDNHDSVKLLAVNLGISIASRLSDAEKEELVLPVFQELAADVGWRVRCKVANEIHVIQLALGAELSKKYVLTMYLNLARDEEAQVREQATKNIVDFCNTLKAQYRELNDEPGFETAFTEHLMPLVKTLYADSNNYVRAEITAHVMTLTSLINSNVARDEFIPLVKNSIEHEEYYTVKEIIAKNLDSLIDVMGMPDIIDSVQKLVEDLIYKSDSRWRIRRGVLLTFIHVSKKSEKEFFDKNLKDTYLKLLYDPVFAVRKTAPLTVPILIKHFGTTWAYSLVPTILSFVEDNHYLYRYIPIFSIEEIINPTLDYQNVCGKSIAYLETLKNLCYDEEETVRNKSAIILVKILKLQEHLKQSLEEGWVEELTKHIETEEYPKDNIRMYAEEIFDAFIANDKFSILEVTADELNLKDEDKTYLEGALYMCNKYFLTTIQQLLRDKIENVPIRTKSTLNRIIQFSQKLQKECEEPWVNDVLGNIPKDEISLLEARIKSRLATPTNKNTVNALDDVELNFALQDAGEDTVEKGTTEAKTNDANKIEEDALVRDEIKEIVNSSVESTK